MEGVFVLVVVVVNRLGDLVAGGARGDQRHVQPCRPGLQRQHDLADVAGDHRADLVVRDGALECANRVGGRALVVIGDDLDLAAVDAALGIDFVGGDLSAARGCRAGDRLDLGDDADLDRLVRLGRGGQGRATGEYGSGCHQKMREFQAWSSHGRVSLYDPSCRRLGRSSTQAVRQIKRKRSSSCGANAGRALQILISRRARRRMLPNACDRFISGASSLEPGRDLHDFSVFADRALASDVHAGRLPQFLRATAVSIDRA